MNTSSLPPLTPAPRTASRTPPLWWPMLGLAGLALAVMMVWYVLTLQQSVQRGLSLREDWRVADAAEVARVASTRGLANRARAPQKAEAAAR